MVDMTPLFIHFAGMLNPEVGPYMTPMSFNKQRYFKSLTDELLKMCILDQVMVGTLVISSSFSGVSCRVTGLFSGLAETS